MADKIEVLQVKFNGKSFFSWEFQVCLFLRGKNLWGHIDGTLPIPTDNAKLGQWEANDVKIMSWITSSVDQQIVLNLCPYKTAKDMWDYLSTIYNQDNSTRKYQLKCDISEYSQGNKSIQDYYSRLVNLWTEYTELVYSTLSVASLPDFQKEHKDSQRDQFLMKLRVEYELVRSNLLSRVPTPSLNECLGELLREEQRLLTQATIDNNGTPAFDVAFVSQAKPRDLSKVQCYCCKEYGYVANQCKKKVCNYCKKKQGI